MTHRSTFFAAGRRAGAPAAQRPWPRRRPRSARRPTSRRQPTRTRDRRRRRSSATLGSGSCRRAKCWATGTWSASVYRRGTNYIQGYTNVADFAGTFALGIEEPRRDLRIVSGRHAHRSRHPPALRERPDVWRLHRSLPAGEPGLDAATTSAICTLARNSTCWSEYRAEARGACRPRHRQAADGQEGCRRQHRQGRLRRSTSSSARKRRSSSKSQASAATNSAAAPTASTLRPARSAGARGWRSPRATCSASPAN